MDKREAREKWINIVLVIAGLALVAGLVIYGRWGLGWFTHTAWAKVSVAKWISAAIVLTIAVVLQYYFLMLLRHSIVKYLVLWLIPIAWLFDNGLVALHRLFESAANETFLTGWLPVTDLLSWLLGAVFFPIIIGGGVVVGIIDSGGNFMSQVCSVAGISMDITGTSVWDVLSHVPQFLHLFWDQVVHSFMHAVFPENFRSRSFFDNGLDSLVSLPHWLYSIGYSFTCLLS